MRSAHPLRIVQVFNRYLQPGGEEKSVARIAEDLESAGHEVQRFWRSSDEWQGRGAPSRARQIFLLWNNPEVLAELGALHRRFRPDVWILHNVLPVVSLGVYRLARRLGVPIFQWLHNYRPISPSGTLFAGGRPLHPDDPFLTLKEIAAGTWRGRVPTALLSAFYTGLWRRGDFSAVRAWVAVSDDVKSAFIRAGYNKDQLFTLRHSWHLRPESPPPPVSEKCSFLFLGRMVETKGVRFLTELWQDSRLEGAQLVMAGAGPARDELERTTPPSMVWVGHVEGAEKDKWLLDCRAILFPALWAEPLSTVAYEAYQAGKPIFASDLGGMREIVFDRQTGRLLPAGDRAAWREAICSLDPETARLWGSEGRRWLKDNVSVAAWNHQFDEIVRSALPEISH